MVSGRRCRGAGVMSLALMLDISNHFFYRFRMMKFPKAMAAKTLGLLFLFCFTGKLTAQPAHPSFEPLFSFDEKPGTSYTAEQVFETGLLFSECERDSQIWKSC